MARTLLLILVALIGLGLGFYLGSEFLTPFELTTESKWKRLVVGTWHWVCISTEPCESEGEFVFLDDGKFRSTQRFENRVIYEQADATWAISMWSPMESVIDIDHNDEILGFSDQNSFVLEYLDPDHLDLRFMTLIANHEDSEVHYLLERIQ